MSLPVVVDLQARRELAGGSSPLRCACGSEWFTLVGRPSDPAAMAHGAIALTPDGRITAYAGEPACVECGRIVELH